MSKFSESVFNFILTEMGSDNFISKYWDIEYDPSLSPSHGEDIPYLFDYSDDKETIEEDFVVQINEKEKSLKQTIIQLWTSFAKNGRPSGENATVGPTGVGPAARVDRKEDHLREGKRVLPIFKPGLDSSQMNHKLDQNREIVFVIQKIMPWK